MPILADISRRFLMLTTDAKPDPPRISIDENSYNTSGTNSNETPSGSGVEGNFAHRDDSNDRLRKERNASSGDGESTFSNTAKDTGKKANVRSRKASYNGQPKNVINYNIVNSSGVKIGGTTTYVCNINQYGKNHKENNGENNPTATTPTTKPMPESVAMLSKCMDELTMKHMFMIKTHIDNSWREIFKSLGYSKGQLDQFEESHKSKGVDEMIYQILLDWKREKGKEAQVGLIVKTLWQYHQYDCAERLAAANSES